MAEDAKTVAQDADEIVQLLLALNREITAGIREYNSFEVVPEIAPHLRSERPH